MRYVDCKEHIHKHTKLCILYMEYIQIFMQLMVYFNPAVFIILIKYQMY